MIRGREMTGGQLAAIESDLRKDAAAGDRYDAAPDGDGRQRTLKAVVMSKRESLRRSPMCSLGRDRPKTRYFGARTLDAERCAPDFGKINTEVLQHLAAQAGLELHVRIDIEAHARRVRRQQDSDSVRERADAEVRPEQLRDRLIQRRLTADGCVR